MASRPHPTIGFPATGHDHDSCVEDALTRATQVCEGRHVRLTPLRRRVLELVWRSHKPVGAYEILDVLHGERGGGAPPTVYRALEFLLENGLIHRIESLNAYVGCAKPGTDHAWQILICRSCGRAAEISDDGLETAVSRAADRAGFIVQRRTIELAGLCPACRSVASADGKGAADAHGT